MPASGPGPADRTERGATVALAEIWNRIDDAWVRALTTANEPPVQAGICWIDTSAGRLRELRLEVARSMAPSSR